MPKPADDISTIPPEPEQAPQVVPADSELVALDADQTPAPIKED